MSEVTHILAAIEQGDPCATEKLLPLVYDELRKLAAQKLMQEAPGHTLQPTALVHEAYLRLVGGASPKRLSGESGQKRWDDRGHFFADGKIAEMGKAADAALKIDATSPGALALRTTFRLDQHELE